MAPSLRLWKRLAGAAIIFVLAGCTVGPAFKRPQAPAAKTYTETALPARTESAPVAGGPAQSFALGKDIQARWWELFHSPQLDSLVRLGLARSRTLTAAQAALRQAYENERAQMGALLYPKVDAKATAEREKFSSAAFGQPGGHGIIFNLFNASASVSYLFDLFGGSRLALEALGAQTDYQRYQLEGAYIALTANIVTTAVKEASMRAQIKAAKEILSAEEEQLGIVEKQFALGGVSRSSVLAQRTQLAQTRATLPPLETALSQTRHQLAVLAGTLPGNAGELPEFNLHNLQLPLELPVSLPSKLVRQRPDILASEALLHAASAQIGVATAAMLPQITFTGSIGTETTKASDLFTSKTSIWNLGMSLLQPIFHGGELIGKRRAAVAAYEQALAQYQETVLTAFQNVADTLRALDKDASTLKAQTEAWTAARDSLELAQNQFRVGAVSYLTLLNAQRQYQQARLNLVQAQAARFADTAALFQALGGGWWNQPAETGAATADKK
ncbi:MAG: efflux transporter outer membrane subunit [Nitrospiraceae bacterium]|nr:efflux transporter outer membrane subunit [Nitrospiraceae bacterium]